MMASELSLNGPWLVRGFPNCNGEELRAHNSEASTQDWLPATVPGTIHTDLFANNVIPDPFKGLNEKKVQWVAGYEWWYRREIELAAEFIEKQVVELVCDGLDTFATVWVNGVKVGEANNMFTPWRFNVKDAVRAGRNTVVVRFKPIYKVASELEQQHKSKYCSLSAENCSSRPYVRKAQYSFGWDWGPTLPTCGIWRKTKIVAYDHAKVSHISGLPIEVAANKAKVKLTAQIFAPKPLRLRVKFSLAGFGKNMDQSIDLDVIAGRNSADCTFEISEPRLWWPAGYGQPCLYDSTVQVYVGSELLDRASCQVGIRKVELLQEPDEEGVGFVLKINGLPVFCKGANWVPADSFLSRVSEDRYRKLLDSTIKMNANCIRVWGGGVYEDDLFYDLCDKLGIMVWQDFMYVCAGYPEEDWFLREAEREAEETVLRLRGHPSIVVWCGNNENQWLHRILWSSRDKVERLFGLQIYEPLLAKVCQRLDSTRPYRPSTPYGGEDFSGRNEGDRHNWEVWSQGVDYTAYVEDKGRFLSEFGWQAPPSLELFEAYLDKDHLNPKSEGFLAREKQTQGLELLQRLLALHYPVPEDIGRFVIYSQLNQGEALKTAIAHWRSRMFKTSGCLIWQLNDCWPVISWSLIDYGLNAKPAYFFVKRAFQPIIASLILKEGKAYVHVVNEAASPLSATLRLQVTDFYGKTKFSNEIQTSTAPYSSKLALEQPLEAMLMDDNHIIVYSLESEGRVLFEDAKTVKEPKEITLPHPSIEKSFRKVGFCEFEVNLLSRVFAKAVYVKLEGTKAEFDDNYIDLLPNRAKTVRCILEKDLSPEEFERKLILEAYPYIVHA